MMMEGSDDEEGPFEVFGVHRLKLAPSTRSGYVGVRPTKSKKPSWQAWVHIKGEKRRCLGLFQEPALCCCAKGSCVGLWHRTVAKPEEAGSSQLR